MVAFRDITFCKGLVLTQSDSSADFVGLYAELRYTLAIERCARMMYFKSVLAGLGTVLLGCVVAPIGMMAWTSWNSHSETTVSFSPMGLTNHLSHSLGFWVFILVLFTAGLVPYAFFAKR